MSVIKTELAAHRFKLAFVLKVIAGIALAVVIVAFARWYFQVNIFYVDEDIYKLVHDQGHRLTYESSTGPPLQVTHHEADRIVTLENKAYKISPYMKNNQPWYQVYYPNGKVFDVERVGHMMRVYDEKGEWVIQFRTYSGNQRLLSPGEEIYYPGEFVEAVYPEYHQKQGTPIYYWLGVFLLIVGWCEFRYEKFQTFLFWISLKWIWTENPEPNAFYYFMAKVGGVVAMILGSFLILSSLK